MRQHTLALAFHTLQAHEKSGEKTGKRKAVSKKINGKNAATLKLPALQHQILKCCVVFSRARVDAFGHIRSRFLLLSFYFQNLLKRESNQATIEDSFHIKRPVATPLPLRLLPQMVFQDHVAFPESQAAGISPVRTKQRCVP